MRPHLLGAWVLGIVVAIGLTLAPSLTVVERIPECGGWLVVESMTSTTVHIHVEPHGPSLTPIAGYFWGIHPWQINAEVHGEPGTAPVQTWVIENLGPNIEWTFGVHEISVGPHILACSKVTFMLPYDKESRR